MSTKERSTGPGHVRWDKGGWFGSQAGGTAWMLVGAVVLLPHAPEVAGIWMVCFAIANGIGSWMWLRRERIRPYPALQTLLLACGVSGLTALAALHVLRPGLRITRPVGIYLAAEPRTIVLLVVLVASLMAWFHILESSATKQSARSDGRALR
jgi:hypothetical protein